MLVLHKFFLFSLLGLLFVQGPTNPKQQHASVVKVLLDRGVDVTVKDTFYNSTAISWAMQNGHAEVVRLIFEKDPSGVDEVLMTGVRGSNEALVKVALDRGGAPKRSADTMR
jgi:hypothetical protein